MRPFSQVFGTFQVCKLIVKEDTTHALAPINLAKGAFNQVFSSHAPVLLRSLRPGFWSCYRL